MGKKDAKKPKAPSASRVSSSEKVQPLLPTKKSTKATANPPAEDHAMSVDDEEDWEDEEDSDEDEDETGGVDEEGMKRLMEALGEDGLDEFDAAQLNALQGGDDDDDSEESGSEALEGDGEHSEEEEVEDEEGVLSDESSDEGDEDEAQEEEEAKTGKPSKSRTLLDAEEEEEDVEVPLDDLSSIDEDVVPKQKVVINNKVRVSLFFLFVPAYGFYVFRASKQVILIHVFVRIHAKQPDRPTKNTRNHPTRSDLTLDRDPERNLPRRTRRPRCG